MSLEDQLSAKGVPSNCSSAQSTPDKNYYVLRGSEVLQAFLNSGSRREHYNKENKVTNSKIRMAEHQLKACNKSSKKSEKRKAAPTSNSAFRKQNRKRENPTRFVLEVEPSSEFGCPTKRICKNYACKAILSTGDAFCRRCSCCICHHFDDNKDPSLWLVCESETAPGYSCGMSCHIECAFQQEKLGVVNLGQYMHLDGSYCCTSCGKISGILGCWKKQLAIAKDARRVDVLCYRIFLSYRLLDGTSRFKELHEIVTEAKAKLEEEVGPMSGESVKMARGLVSRLAIVTDVQNLCSNAIDKADEWLAKVSSTTLNCTVDSLPAACRFLFKEVTSCSLVIVLIDVPTPYTDCIKGYKLWYCKTREETFSEEPVYIFPREKRIISIKHLHPCTEYTFRIISFTEAGDLGHCEAKCLTKSIEIINKNPSSSGNNKDHIVEGPLSAKEQLKSDLVGYSSGSKVQDLWKVLQLARAQEQGHVEGFCNVDIEQYCGVTESDPPKDNLLPPVSRELDLNVVSVPDLNEDLTPPLESSRDEDNGCTLELAIVPDDNAASHGIGKDGLAKSNGSGPRNISQAWTLTQYGEVPSADSSLEIQRTRPLAIEEYHDYDSILISNGSPFRLSDGHGSLDESFEYCVKRIRKLEIQHYISQEFRLKFLSWFSLRSTDQERRVVNTFIRTLSDDPKLLAGQLIDSFADIISSKRPKNSFICLPPYIASSNKHNMSEIRK